MKTPALDIISNPLHKANSTPVLDHDKLKKPDILKKRTLQKSHKIEPSEPMTLNEGEE